MRKGRPAPPPGPAPPPEGSHAPPRIEVGSCSEPNTLMLVLSGEVTPGHLPTLATRLRSLLEGSDAGRIVCDVRALVQPDAVTVDALARLQLAARRSGRDVSLLRPTPELQDLLALVGLDEVLPPCGDPPARD